MTNRIAMLSSDVWLKGGGRGGGGARAAAPENVDGQTLPVSIRLSFFEGVFLD